MPSAFDFVLIDPDSGESIGVNYRCTILNARQAQLVLEAGGAVYPTVWPFNPDTGHPSQYLHMVNGKYHLRVNDESPYLAMNLVTYYPSDAVFKVLSPDDRLDGDYGRHKQPMRDFAYPTDTPETIAATLEVLRGRKKDNELEGGS
jgi:hypothetical protein